MSSLSGWILTLAVAVVVTVAAAAAHLPNLHMAMTALVSFAIAALAVRDHQRLMTAGAPTTTIAASTARYLGLAWAWAALALALTYLLIIDARWPEWWQFFLGFGFAAVASLFFANLVERNTRADQSDDALVKIGRRLVQVQLVGMAAGLVSLFIEGKFPRDIAHADWAGCNIFFFGALAIAAISLDALRSQARV